MNMHIHMYYTGTSVFVKQINIFSCLSMHIHFKAIVVLIHVHCIIKVVQKKILVAIHTWSTLCWSEKLDSGQGDKH